MDSQGWIELSMIASFNRIKSLTPDVAVVEEVMEISSLLELKDGMVRLAGDEAALRWVLPGARPSKFAGGSPGAAHLSPRKLAGEGAELSLSVPGGMPSAIDTLGPDALDMLHTAPNPLPKFDVENALMRNVSTNGHARLSGGDAASASSATASVLASDLASEEGKTMTPETSVAGDSKSELETDVDIEFPYKQPIDAMLAAKLAAAAGRAEAKAAEAKAAESQNL
jgi:la-related protein 1